MYEKLTGLPGLTEGSLQLQLFLLICDRVFNGFCAQTTKCTLHLGNVFGGIDVVFVEFFGKCEGSHSAFAIMPYKIVCIWCRIREPRYLNVI